MKMQQPTFKHIRGRLAQLIDKQTRIRSAVSDAGLSAKEIEFQGSADDIWSSVIEEASKHSALPAVIREVLRRYPIEARRDSALSEALTEELKEFPKHEVLIKLQDVMASEVNAVQSSERLAIKAHTSIASPGVRAKLLAVVVTTGLASSLLGVVITHRTGETPSLRDAGTIQFDAPRGLPESPNLPLRLLRKIKVTILSDRDFV